MYQTSRLRYKRHQLLGNFVLITASAFISHDVVIFGLLYMAYPDGCRLEITFLLRLMPYPMRGHGLLCVISHVYGMMRILTHAAK